MEKIKIKVSGVRKSGKSKLIEKIKSFLTPKECGEIIFEEEILGRAGDIYEIVNKRSGVVEDSSINRKTAVERIEELNNAAENFYLQSRGSYITLKTIQH
jgi:ABC-type uncharacterized transport system ATPase subunit